MRMKEGGKLTLGENTEVSWAAKLLCKEAMNPDSHLQAGCSKF